MKLTRTPRDVCYVFLRRRGARQPQPNYWTLIGLWKCDGRPAKAIFFVECIAQWDRVHALKTLLHHNIPTDFFYLGNDFPPF